jgi:hypothetical protein
MNTRFTQSFLFLYAFLLVATFFFLPFFVTHAQFAATNDEESVQVDVLPKNPQPGDVLSFRVTSYLSDLERSKITWTVNGTKVLEGIGEREFMTKMGALGTDTRVTVTILTNEDKTITRSFTFAGARVDLVWEAESSVPPFYKGKALIAQYGNVKVVAFPHIGTNASAVSPSTLIYTWKKNGRVLGTKSGYGKNVLYLDRTDTGDLSTVSVTVSNQDKTLTIGSEVTLTPTEPKVIPYVYNPAYGTLLNIALTGQMKMTTKELNIIAVPYFYAANSNMVPFLDYEWSLNDVEVSGMINPVFTVRNEASTTGASTIGVTVINKIGSMVQQQSSSFTLGF